MGRDQKGEKKLSGASDQEDDYRLCSLSLPSQRWTKDVFCRFLDGNGFVEVSLEITR